MSFSDKFLRINLRQEINYSLINKSPVNHGSLKASKKYFLWVLISRVEKIQRNIPCRVWARSLKNALLSKLLRALKKRFNEPCKCNTEILSTLQQPGNLGFRQKEKQTFKFFLIISTLTKQTNLFSFFQEGSDSEKAIISDWLFLRMNEQSFSLKSFMLQP